MSEIIFLSNVRLSFPHLAEPQRKKNEQTGAERVSYNCEFIMPQDHAGFTQFMARYGAMALEKWKEHAQTIMGMVQQDRKSRCYGLGTEKIRKSTLLPYDGYNEPGAVFITAGRDTPPQIIQADGSPIDPSNTMAYQQLTRKMYGGCYVNAAIKPWLQDNKHGRGIRCDLIAVQFAGDGKPFGEGEAEASSMFGAVAQAPAGMFGAAQMTQQPMPTAPFAAASLPPFMMGQ